MWADAEVVRHLALGQAALLAHRIEVDGTDLDFHLVLPVDAATPCRAAATIAYVNRPAAP